MFKNRFPVYISLTWSWRLYRLALTLKPKADIPSAKATLYPCSNWRYLLRMWGINLTTYSAYIKTVKPDDNFPYDTIILWSENPLWLFLFAPAAHPLWQRIMATYMPCRHFFWGVLTAKWSDSIKAMHVVIQTGLANSGTSFSYMCIIT